MKIIIISSIPYQTFIISINKVKLVYLKVFIKYFKLNLLLSILVLNASGQICSEGIELKQKIERKFNEKVYDSLDLLINQLPKKEGICFQEFLMYKSKFHLIHKKLDSVRYYIYLIEKSLNLNFNAKVNGELIHIQGRYYYNKENNDSASMYFIKSLEIGKKNKDISLQIKSLNSLSNVFANLNQFEKAVSYGKEGLSLSLKINDKASEILLLGNLLGYYGKLYLKDNNDSFLDSAKIYSEKLIVESRNQKNTYQLLKGFSGLGSCFLQLQDYKKALAYSDTIIILTGDTTYLKILMQAYGNKCDAHIYLKELKKAEEAASKAIGIALSEKDKNAASDLYYKLYDCENELKNYEKALEYYIKHKEYKDSVNSEEQFLIVNDLEQRYNKFENEKTISDLTNEKRISSLKINILIISVISVIILIGLLIYIYRQKSLKQKHILLETEQRLNRSRINPHFFFNSITSLQGIALKENDGKTIYRNLFTFSKLMRETLESSYSDMVTISTEISFLKNYIELQKLNLRDKFTFDVQISPEIDEETILLPSMIIQPFVENSIEHGFNEITSGGIIKIEFDIIEGELFVAIIDNGKGFNNQKTKEKNHTSRAMQITTDRLNLLNNLHKTNARFFIDFNNIIGTKVEIFLPLMHKDEGFSSR